MKKAKIYVFRLSDVRQFNVKCKKTSFDTKLYKYLF